MSAGFVNLLTYACGVCRLRFVRILEYSHNLVSHNDEPRRIHGLGFRHDFRP